eukprot:2221110-Prymnesium_polylepis.1
MRGRLWNFSTYRYTLWEHAPSVPRCRSLRACNTSAANTRKRSTRTHHEQDPTEPQAKPPRRLNAKTKTQAQRHRAGDTASHERRHRRSTAARRLSL